MKTTYYYNFLRTKAEEEVALANKNTQLTKVLIEIRELYPQPQPDLLSPWKIKKTVTNDEIMSGKLKLWPNDVHEHVFGYWPLNMVNQAVMGHAQSVAIWDVTEEEKPIRYVNENCFLETGSGGGVFVVGFKEVVRDRCINPGDEVGLLWHSPTTSFHFKILRRVD